MIGTKIEWTGVLVARFWSYVDVRGLDECWPWKAGCFEGGYGQFRLNKRKVKAHRMAYELTRGALPGGFFALHRCDNPPCCNPVHMFGGTQADNAHDRDAKGRTARVGASLPGERNPSAKLSSEQVARVRAAAASGATQRAIASRLGMSQSQIGNIVRRSSWA